MIKALLISTLFLSQTIFAAQGEVSTLIKLSNTVKSLALTTEASQEDIDSAETKLREAIELLASDSSSSSGGQGAEFGACYDFAFQKYSQGFAATTAASKATAACKQGLELEVAEFLYSKYSQGFAATTAMDKTAAAATKNMRNKLGILKFAYEKYSQGYAATTAADKAVQVAASLGKNSLVCVEKLYASYSQGYAATTAMDKAAEGCAK